MARRTLAANCGGAAVFLLVVGTKPMTPAIEPHIEIAPSLRSSQ